MIGARARREINIWPGWVDALSSLIMVVIFVLMIFAVVQSLMQNAILNREDALGSLNDRIAELAEALAIEQARAEELREERDTLELRLTRVETALAETEAQSRRLAGELDAERRAASTSQARITLLTTELETVRAELNRLNAALEASEEREAQRSAQIVDLTDRLNKALASKVEELALYRSEFFGRVREVLGDRPEIRTVGDRFVLQSEVLFESGQASLSPGGQERLERLAATLREVVAEIPDDIDWVLRVDGHTDSVPIATAAFPSNWELSAARAISVVKFLIGQGIPAERLVAAGFGEFQPIADGETAEDLARNRRIELKFDQRATGS